MKDTETIELVAQLENQLVSINDTLTKLHLNDTIVQMSSSRTSEGPTVLELISCIQYNTYYKKI